MAARTEIEALLARVAQGDRKALRALYHASAARLYGIACHILQDEAQAEEVLQEVFERIWARAGLYRDQGFSPWPWLVTQVRDASVRRLRGLRAEGRAPVSTDITDRLYDLLPRPGTSAELTENARDFQAALGELPPDRADFLRQAYLRGETYADWTATGGSDAPPALRVWVRRSVLHLRESLSR